MGKGRGSTPGLVRVSELFPEIGRFFWLSTLNYGFNPDDP